MGGRSEFDPWSRRSPGEVNSNPIQYSCLQNFMDGGVWQATINGISESCTQLSNFTSHESVCLVLLAARSPDYISPNQGKNRLGNTHSQSTLHWNLCFLNGTVSVHYKSLYTALNVQGNGLPWIWDSRKYGKISILLLWKQDTCSLKPATKTHWVIFLFVMTTAFVHYLSFLKLTYCWPLLTGKSSPSSVSLN